MRGVPRGGMCGEWEGNPKNGISRFFTYKNLGISHRALAYSCNTAFSQHSITKDLISAHTNLVREESLNPKHSTLIKASVDAEDDVDECGDIGDIHFAVGVDITFVGWRGEVFDEMGETCPTMTQI